MEKEECISRINQILSVYFEKYPEISKVPAKDLMPLFIEAGIFDKNYKDGLPIRNLLRELDKKGQHNRIPYLYFERKNKNTNWYFCPILNKREKMNHKLILIPFFLLFFMGFITSCSKKTDSTFPKISHIAFRNNENGKWGLISVDGKVLFENKFEDALSYAVNGVFRIFTHDTLRYQYYTATKEPRQIGPSGYKDGGLCSEGIIPVTSPNERIHYITESGETAFYLLPYGDKEILAVSSFFSNQRARIMLEDYKYGFIDPEGHVVISPIYDYAFPFHDGIAIVRKDAVWIAVDVNGNKIFEVKSSGHEYDNPLLFYNGYSVIENSLYNSKGEKKYEMPPNISYISSFKGGVALYQDEVTKLWGQMRGFGENIGKAKYSRALGMIDDMAYVGDDTTPFPDCMNRAYVLDKDGKVIYEDESVKYYMNVSIINKKGEVCNRLKNVSCFYPLYNSIVVANEKGEFYFADKNGNPIDDTFYSSIYVPAHSNTPGYSCLSFLGSTYLPPTMFSLDYDSDVYTDYIDDVKTVASILDKLTIDGIWKLKIGQNILDIKDLFNKQKVPIGGWTDLEKKDYGINHLYATYSINVFPNDYKIHFIKVNLQTEDIPEGFSSERTANAISKYLTETLKWKKFKEEDMYLYKSEWWSSYDIIHVDGATVLFLADKSLSKYLGRWHSVQK